MLLYIQSFKNNSFILSLHHKHLPPYPGSSSFREDAVLASDVVAVEAVVGIVGSDVGAAVAAIINRIIREGFCITHLETRRSTEWKGNVYVTGLVSIVYPNFFFPLLFGRKTRASVLCSILF